MAQVASPEPDAAAAGAGEPHSAHRVETSVGAVAAASAQLVAAEERLTTHNEALAGWVGVLEEIRSQLAAALVREQEVRAGLASIGARVERLEHEQAARDETARGRHADEAGRRLLPELRALQRSSADDERALRALAAALAEWAETVAEPPRAP